jgi:hypothetical protein
MLVIGLRRHETGGVEGHIWVTVDGRAIAENPGFLATFTTLVSYDADGREHAARGATANLSGVRFA